MTGKLETIIDVFWMKIRHPAVKTNGIHYVRPGTEIVLALNGKLDIGRWVKAYKRVTFAAVGGEISIGEDTTFTRNDIISCREKITIGKNCSFGPNVCIYDHDHLYDKNGTKNRGFKTSPIIIDDNCWVGANVVILRGTHIGKGSVIGAGTVLKGNIPCYSLVKLDRELIIQELQRTEI